MLRRSSSFSETPIAQKNPQATPFTTPQPVLQRSGSIVPSSPIFFTPSASPQRPQNNAQFYTPAPFVSSASNKSAATEKQTPKPSLPGSDVPAQHPALTLILQQQSTANAHSVTRHQLFNRILANILGLAVLFTFYKSDAFTFCVGIFYLTFGTLSTQIRSEHILYGLERIVYLIAAVFGLNILTSIYYLIYPKSISPALLRDIPLTETQREILKLPSNVGKTVGEKDRIQISPLKDRHISAPVTPSRHLPPRMPTTGSTIFRQPLTDRKTSPILRIPQTPTPIRVLGNLTPTPHRSGETIINELMEKDRQSEISQKLFKTTPSKSMINESSLAFKTFQPASRAPSEYTIHEEKSNTESKEKTTIGIASPLAFEEVLMKLDLKDTLNTAMKLRQWLRNHVFVEVSKLINDIDAAFKQENLEQFSTRKITLMGPVESGQISFVSLQELSSKSTHPMVRARLTLESFLLIPRVPLAREYIVDRIQTLSSDVDLGPFVFDGGMEYRGEKWTSELPTDAEILFHLFCTFMDEKMKALGIYTSPSPFTSQFVLTSEPRLNDDLMRLRITCRNPLRVNLSLGKQIWTVFEGRNNVFYAIMAFVRYYQIKSAGYMDSLYLGGQLGLLDVLGKADP